MLALVDKLAEERRSLALANQLEEQRREAHLEEQRRKLERSRYYRVVAEDLFNKKQYEQSLVYYLKLLDLFRQIPFLLPEESLFHGQTWW